MKKVLYFTVLLNLLFGVNVFSQTDDGWTKWDNCFTSETPPDLPPPLESEVDCRNVDFSIYDHVLGLSNTQYSTQIGSGLSGNIFVLAQGFIVDSPFSFTNATVIFQPNSSITVEPDQTLTIGISTLMSCELLWNGITLEEGATITTGKRTVIQDAKAAINTTKNATLNVKGTTFNANRVGISIAGSSLTNLNNSSFGAFSGNRFYCTAPLKGTSNEYTKAGVVLDYCRDIILSAQGGSVNIFQGINNGIMSYNSTLTVEDCKYF